MCREPNFDQLGMMMDIHEGDKVKLTNGDVAEFVRAKKKKFIGIMNGTSYDIPIAMLESIVEQIDQQQKKDDNKAKLKQLKKGDWFYINKSGSAILFKFEKIERSKIIGINPITNSITKIDMGFTVEVVK